MLIGHGSDAQKAGHGPITQQTEKPKPCCVHWSLTQNGPEWKEQFSNIGFHKCSFFFVFMYCTISEHRGAACSLITAPCIRQAGNTQAGVASSKSSFSEINAFIPSLLYFYSLLKRPLFGEDGHSGIKKPGVYWLAYFTGFCLDTDNVVNKRPRPGFSQAANRRESEVRQRLVRRHFLRPKPISQKCGYERSFTPHIRFSSGSTWSVQGVLTSVMSWF